MLTSCGSLFLVYVSSVITRYTLNLHSVVSYVSVKLEKEPDLNEEREERRSEGKVRSFFLLLSEREQFSQNNIQLFIFG